MPFCRLYISFAQQVPFARIAGSGTISLKAHLYGHVYYSVELLTASLRFSMIAIPAKRTVTDDEYHEVEHSKMALRHVHVFSNDPLLASYLASYLQGETCNIQEEGTSFICVPPISRSCRCLALPLRENGVVLGWLVCLTS